MKKSRKNLHQKRPQKLHGHLETLIFLRVQCTHSVVSHSAITRHHFTLDLLQHKINMSDADAELAAKRKRQKKKMTKILSKAWSIDRAEPFQEVDDDQVLVLGGEGPMDLTTMGQGLENSVYQLGRKGWEQFACDLGGIYNRFIAW